MAKDVQIYFIGLKKDLFGCFRIEEIRGKDNKTGLKEGGGIEMSTTVLPFRDALSLCLNTYLNLASSSPLTVVCVLSALSKLVGIFH